MIRLKKKLAYFLLFVVAALLFTYPLAVQVGSGLRGDDIIALGDPLLNTWVLAQNVQKLVHLDFKGFFDGNMFFPQSKTILYSEILLPQSLMALPVHLLTGNPVLAYNVVFLLGFVLSGFGMFCLVHYLTKSAEGGIAAGIIYAFCPFMLAHTYQIQVISAWGIPFTFLYLHKYIDHRRLKHLLLFTFFYIAQSLSNGYYALYLTFFMGLWILYWTIVQKKYLDRRFWGHMALFSLIALAATGPFYYQYAKVHSEMGFVRGMDFYARLSSYLATPSINRLYGKITAQFFRAEGELFPGVVAVALGLLGIFALVKARKVRKPVEDRTKKVFFFVRRAVNVLLVLTSAVIVVIMGQDGLRLRVGHLLILKAHNIRRPIHLLIILILARVVLDRIFEFKPAKPKDSDERNLKLYAVIFFLAFLFTLGPSGPYTYLYKYFPGFKAVRVASRFDIFVMFGLALLAAYGLRNILGRLRPAGKTAITVLVVLVMGFEYLSIPMPYHSIAVKNQISDIYRWLAAVKKPGVLVELPFPPYDTGSSSIEAARMYFSIYHGMTLINGYSGYFPPLYTELCRRFEKYPFERLVDDFRALHVRYILVHLYEIKERFWPQWNAKLSSLLDTDLKLLKYFDYDFLFEVIPRPSAKENERSLAGLKKLPRTGWTVHASINDSLTPFIRDGNPITRWDSGPQKPGDFIQIELKKPQILRCVSLKFSPSWLDFPRAYKMEISMDGKNWIEVARETQTDLPILSFKKPKDLALNIFLPPRETRRIRITNLGQENNYYWSIYEADLYE